MPTKPSPPQHPPTFPFSLPPQFPYCFLCHFFTLLLFHHYLPVSIIVNPTFLPNKQGVLSNIYNCLHSPSTDHIVINFMSKNTNPHSSQFLITPMLYIIENKMSTDNKTNKTYYIMKLASFIYRKPVASC